MPNYLETFLDEPLTKEEYKSIRKVCKDQWYVVNSKREMMSAKDFERFISEEFGISISQKRKMINGHKNMYYTMVGMK